MKLRTKHFGELEVDESKIICFENGIPGFPEDKNFVILSDPEGGNEVLHWLQSVDDGDIALVLIDTFRMLPDYDPLVNEEELAELAPFEKEDLLVYNIAVIPEDITKATINLKAPVIVNIKNSRGKQVIVNNDEYSVRHCLFDETNNKSEK